jgi:hypothetical protein
VKPRHTPRDWRRAVLREPNITDATRVVLLVLVDYMRTDLTVSVPRKDLARWLNRSEKRIQERIKNAHDAGLLDTVSPGHRGHTAVYAGLFPEADRGTDSRAQSMAGFRPPMAPDSGTPGGPTSSKQPAERFPRGRVPNERQHLGAAPRESGAHVRADVDQLRNHHREEKSA